MNTTSTLPDYALFQEFAGRRSHLAPRLLAALGEQRDRFQGADELLKYSGIAPVAERSGKKSWVHWRWQSPTFRRQTFVEWAGQTIWVSWLRGRKGVTPGGICGANNGFTEADYEAIGAASPR